MDRFTALQAFVAACTAGTFSGAGRSLRISATMVAKHIDALESRLGVRLFHRTTRRLTLTEKGHALRERASALLEDLASAERAVSADRDTPHGTLMLNVPMSYGVMRVAPLVAEFVQMYSEVRVETAYVDRMVDPIDEGWDLAIRIAANLPDSSSLVARPISTERLILCAAPDYLAAHGAPTHPTELATHACLTYTLSLGSKPGQWHFLPVGEHAGQAPAASVEVNGPISASNGDALRTAALKAHGFILQPAFIVAKELALGHLQEVQFDGFEAGRLTVYAVFPQGRYLSSKVRTFVDLAITRLQAAAIT